VSLALLLLTVTPVQAQDRVTNDPATGDSVNEEASRAFWLGKDHYDAGDFALALEQFRRAFALTSDPDLLYNIAQSYRKMAKCAAALENYRSFLRAAPDSPLAPQAAKQVSQLQSSCDVPVARPLSVAATGTEHAGNTGMLPNGDQAHEESRSLGGTAKANVSGQPSPAKQTWALVALAGGVVVGGVATGLEIWNHGRHDQWTARDQNLAMGNVNGESQTAWVVRQQANDNLGRSIDRVQLEVLSLSIGAGALLATSVIVYLWSPSEKKQPRASASPRINIAVQPVSVGPQPGAVSILGTF